MGKIKIMQAENSLPPPLFTFLMVRPLFAELRARNKQALPRFFRLFCIPRKIPI